MSIRYRRIAFDVILSNNKLVFVIGTKDRKIVLPVADISYNAEWSASGLRIPCR